MKRFKLVQNINNGIKINMIFDRYHRVKDNNDLKEFKNTVLKARFGTYGQNDILYMINQHFPIIHARPLGCDFMEFIKRILDGKLITGFGGYKDVI